jgi:hypothetical protein
MDVVDIIASLEKGTARMTEAQRKSTLAQIFGAEALVGVNTILKSGTDELREYRTSLEQAGGASKAVADSIKNSLENRLLLLKNKLSEVGLRIIDAFEAKFPDAINKAMTAIEQLNVDKVIDGLEGVYNFVRETVTWIEKLSPLIIGCTTAWVAYHVILKSIVVLQAVSWLIGLTKAIYAAAAAQGVLNAVMAVNPIFLIITTIGLLVAGIVWMVKNWDTVKASFAALCASMKQWWDSVVIAFQQSWERWKARLSGLVSFFSDTISAIINNPIVEKILWVFAPFINVAKLIIRNWEPIKKWFANLWDGIKEKCASAVQWITYKLQPLFDLIDKFKSFGMDIGKSLGIIDSAPISVMHQAQSSPARQAPNQTEVEARQSIGFNGKLTIAGAPRGSTMQSKTTGAPSIKTEFLGVNP